MTNTDLQENMMCDFCGADMEMSYEDWIEYSKGEDAMMKKLVAAAFHIDTAEGSAFLAVLEDRLGKEIPCTDCLVKSALEAAGKVKA